MARVKSDAGFNVVTIALSVLVMSMMLVVVGVSKQKTPEPGVNAAQVASNLQCPENTRATLSCYDNMGKAVQATEGSEHVFCTWECEPGVDYEGPVATPYTQGGGKVCEPVICANNCQITELPNDCQTCYCPGSSYGGFGY